MALENFKTYQLAVKNYQTLEKLPLPRHLKDQLLRASSSIALNLAEGSGKFSKKDQRRFYTIAYGSLQETMAIIQLARVQQEYILELKKLGGHLYKLIKSRE